MNEHSSRSHAIFIVTIECSQVGSVCVVVVLFVLFSVCVSYMYHTVCVS